MTRPRARTAKKDHLDSRCYLRLTEEMKEDILWAAQQTGLSNESAFIRQAVKNEIERIKACLREGNGRTAASG